MNLIWSSFDDAFLDYGLNMYASVSAFNPDIPLYFADFGGLSPDGLKRVQDLGVKVLNRKETWIPKCRMAVDLLAKEFFEWEEWSKILWIDADSVVTDDLSGIFEQGEDFVCIAPAINGSRSTVSDGLLQFALGVWMTPCRRLLDDFYKNLVKNHNRMRSESQMCTNIVNSGQYTLHQLDPWVYNYGRDLVELLQYDGERLYHERDGERRFPKIIAISQIGRERQHSDAIDEFFKSTIGCCHG